MRASWHQNSAPVGYLTELDPRGVSCAAAVPCRPKATRLVMAETEMLPTRVAG